MVYQKINIWQFSELIIEVFWDKVVPCVLRGFNAVADEAQILLERRDLAIGRLSSKCITSWANLRLLFRAISKVS